MLGFALAATLAASPLSRAGPVPRLDIGVQRDTTQFGDASCLAALDSLVRVLQRDYPGYRDRVIGHEAAFAMLVDSVRSVAATPAADSSYDVCLPPDVRLPRDRATGDAAVTFARHHLRTRPSVPDKRTMELQAGPSWMGIVGHSWGASIAAGVRPPGDLSQFSVQLAAAFVPASADSVMPAVAAFNLELLIGVLPLRVPMARPNLFLSAGIGAAYFDARRNQALVSQCGPPTCFEGPHRVESGWRLMLVPGVGLELPLSATLSLRPHARLNIPQGRGGGWNDVILLRGDLSLQWRR